MKGAIRRFAILLLGKQGYSRYMAEAMWKKLEEDLRATNVGIGERIWAYRRGFFAKTALACGLDDGNYRDRENQFHYYRLHPLNGRYGHWIDDKLTYKYILHPFNDYLPRYYFGLENASVVKLMDCPGELSPDISSVTTLLEQEKQLALKASVGTGGAGFYKLSFESGILRANAEELNAHQLASFLKTLDNYLVCEYVLSHEFLRNMYPHAPGTLRIMAIRDSKEGTVIPGALFCFGTSEEGFVSNAAGGGIRAGVDVQTGRIFGARLKKEGRLVQTDVHPDTGAPFPGYVPHWGLITEKVKEIGDYIPQIRYVGYDIIVTEKGFKILEMNSLPDVQLMQLFHPLTKNRHVKKLFYGQG